MEEVHKAVLKRKRVHDDEIVPVPNEIRDHNTAGVQYVFCDIYNFFVINL